MRFEDAVADLTARFGAPEPAKGFEPDQTIHVASGGLIERPIDESPAYCKERALAIRLWRDAAIEALGGMVFDAWAFLNGPHCDLWRITVQDEKCTHRIAADRYSVLSTIGLKGVVQPAPAEAQAEKG